MLLYVYSLSLIYKDLNFFFIIIWMLTVNFDVHMMCVKIIICKKYEC